MFKKTHLVHSNSIDFSIPFRTATLPSGKRLQFANWKMAIAIVDIPSYKTVIFHSYVSLPEGNVQWFQIFVALHRFLIIDVSGKNARGKCLLLGDSVQPAAPKSHLSHLWSDRRWSLVAFPWTVGFAMPFSHHKIPRQPGHQWGTRNPESQAHPVYPVITF